MPYAEFTMGRLEMDIHFEAGIPIISTLVIAVENNALGHLRASF